MDEKQAREDICNIGKLLYDKGMIAGFEGNISCRVSADLSLITPAGVCKGFLRPEMIVRIVAGEPEAGEFEPSSEYLTHLAGYIHRSDFNAAVHAHAPYLSAFAFKGQSLEGSDSIPEFAASFGSIPLVPFAPPGSMRLGEKLAEFVASAHTFLLERHGAISFGVDLWEAFHRLEMAEQLAKTLILSHSIPSSGTAK